MTNPRVAEFLEYARGLTYGRPRAVAGSESLEEGIIYAVDEDTYYEHMEMLPPRWMGASSFAFGEGEGPLILFWLTPRGHFARQLSNDETDEFCRLAGIEGSSA